MKTFSCKTWTKAEEDLLLSIKATDKEELRSALAKMSKKFKREFHKVYQKWYKLQNGFYKRRGKDVPLEFERSEWSKINSNRKANRPRKRMPSKVLKKGVKSVSLSERIRLTPTTISVLDFKRIVVKGNNIKIIY